MAHRSPELGCAPASGPGFRPRLRLTPKTQNLKVQDPKTQYPQDAIPPRRNTPKTQNHKTQNHKKKNSSRKNQDAKLAQKLKTRTPQRPHILRRGEAQRSGEKS
jgi:hypothetical protein